MGLTDYTISDKKYFESGRKYERERIIQLLRSQVTKHYPILEMHIDELETLIKGEQNV